MNVEWLPQALKEMAKLDVPVQDRIIAAANRYAEQCHGDIRRVKVAGGLALRVGKWRVFFDPPEDDVIRFTAVRLRDKAYKK